MKKIKGFSLILVFAMAVTLICGGRFAMKTVAANPISLVVDGKDITSLAAPIVENNRTLVPIRFISEELGADVEWDGTDKTVRVKKGDKSVLLRLASHLVEYNNGDSYDLSDVAAQVINERTYVPLRLVSNALNIGISWDDANNIVNVDSSISSELTPFFDVKILSQNAGQTIEGRTQLQISSSDIYLKDGNEVKFLLLDPKTGRGFVVARGEKPIDSYSWLPKLEDKGNKVLVGAIYDKEGRFIAGDAIPINVNVIPKVNLTGLEEDQLVNGRVEIGADINFVSSYIKYEITNLDNGKVNLTEEQDPQGKFNWNPMYEENGRFSIKVIAYDSNLNPYTSSPVNVQVEVVKKLSLLGVTAGTTIDKPISLMASRNFNVSETEYLIKDMATGIVSTLAKIPYGNYKWSPGPGDSGKKELLVRVKDTRGGILESDPINIVVDGASRVMLEGIGPKQVVTEATKIKVSSNIKLTGVNYTLVNSKTKATRVLASNISPSEEYNYTPLKSDEGDMLIQAEGIYEGKKVLSEQIPFKVYLGEIYGPKPIIEKDKFIEMASGLAKVSREKTGMSAALQTAQSILETGFGQSVPVDKYTGLLSNNLFGIKGQGPVGAVTSNTWEVYNGVTYRVDAEFRAYSDVSASWADHKEFLLNRERYAPLKLVMHDASQGAWALKRAGYATDPQYPMKLMRLIEQYNLLELDKVGI